MTQLKTDARVPLFCSLENLLRHKFVFALILVVLGLLLLLLLKVTSLKQSTLPV